MICKKTASRQKEAEFTLFYASQSFFLTARRMTTAAAIRAVVPIRKNTPLSSPVSGAFSGISYTMNCQSI
jgi:hypothetical protein